MASDYLTGVRTLGGYRAQLDISAHNSIFHLASKEVYATRCLGEDDARRRRSWRCIHIAGAGLQRLHSATSVDSLALLQSFPDALHFA